MNTHRTYDVAATCAAAVSCAALVSAFDVTPVAAVGLTGSAATPVSTTTAVLHGRAVAFTAAAARSVAPRGIVTVTIPPVVFTATDGLPAALVRGRTYTVQVSAVATGGTGGGTLKVTAAGGVLPSCTATLREGQAATVKCQVKVNSTAGKLLVSAVGTTRKYAPIATVYTHAAQ